MKIFSLCFILETLEDEEERVKTEEDSEPIIDDFYLESLIGWVREAEDALTKCSSPKTTMFFVLVEISINTAREFFTIDRPKSMLYSDRIKESFMYRGDCARTYIRKFVSNNR